MSNSKEPHVLIVGAGLVGLLLAQAFKKHGIQFSIFETEESATINRPREWGMSVQWGLPMLSYILPEQMHARLQSTSVDPHYVFPETGNSMPVYNAETGELMKDIPLVKMIRVSRRKFRSLLAEGVDIQYDKRVKSVEPGNTDSGPIITFEDGTVATGSLIIGADGAASLVRRCVFSGDTGLVQQVPYTGVNMDVVYGNADLARKLRSTFTSVMGLGVHPKGYWLWLSAQDVPDPNKPEDWRFQLQWTWKKGTNNENLDPKDIKRLQDEAKGFAEPFRSAWMSIAPDHRMPAANNVSIWPPKPIPSEFQGRVALAGDAAHAMSFHRGQGLNHGIADAVKLCQALVKVKEGQQDLATALQEYETEMVKRAGEEVAISKMNTEMMHDWERLIHSPFMQRGGDKNK